MVKIVADTTSCIPPGEAEQLGIYYLPQIIVFGEETYRDDTEMDPRTFLKAPKNQPGAAKNSCPSSSLVYANFSKIIRTGPYHHCPMPFRHGQRHFPRSNSRRPGFPQRRYSHHRYPSGRRWVGRCRQTGACLGQCWPGCRHNRGQGLRKCAPENEFTSWWIPLSTYIKVGRIGAAKAFFGSILQMKPILTFGEGMIKPFDSQRTHKRAIAD